MVTEGSLLLAEVTDEPRPTPHKLAGGVLASIQCTCQVNQFFCVHVSFIRKKTFKK